MTAKRLYYAGGRVFGALILFGPSTDWPQHDHLQLRVSFNHTTWWIYLKPTKRQFKK